MNATEKVEYLVGDLGVQGHAWAGGYYCRCGHELNSPLTWVRHIARLMDEMDAS